MSAGVDWSNDVFGIAVGTLLLLLSVHKSISLLMKKRSLASWHITDGMLNSLSSYPIYFYPKFGPKTQTGAGIQADYSYCYGAADFKGRFVSILDFPPRLWMTDYRDLATELKAAFEQRVRVPVLLNPESPHQAVLSRQPISSQLKKSLLMLLIGAFFIGWMCMDLPTAASWAYGVGIGIAIYAAFATGLFSTAF